ncbi:hypothetical protein YC2023_120954 [Brassica napus]
MAAKIAGEEVDTDVNNHHSIPRESWDNSIETSNVSELRTRFVLKASCMNHSEKTFPLGSAFIDPQNINTIDHTTEW